MKDFLTMVKKLYHRNYEDSMEAIKEQQIPCAYFYPMEPFEAGNLDAVREWGMNVTTICTWDKNVGEINYPACRVVGLKEFLSDPRKVKIMLLHPQMWLPVIDKVLAPLGVDSISLGHLQDAINRRDFMIDNLPRLYDTYACFGQEESKKAYLAAVAGNVSWQIRDYHFAPEPQYMLEGFIPQENDIAIDGGAYDGGTARLFSSLGAKVYAFEMDKKNYEVCKAKAEQYGFVAENMGLSNVEADAHYNSGGTASCKLDHGAETAHFISVDAYVERANLPRVDYIKLDVEGAERDVLEGAAASILKWKPKMAISAYHRPYDLWDLREYVSALCPSYRFEFRHYPIDVTDYWLSEQDKALLNEYGLGYKIPTSCETVLYCY